MAMFNYLAPDRENTPQDNKKSSLIALPVYNYNYHVSMYLLIKIKAYNEISIYLVQSTANSKLNTYY